MATVTNWHKGGIFLEETMASDDVEIEASDVGSGTMQELPPLPETKLQVETKQIKAKPATLWQKIVSFFDDRLQTCFRRDRVDHQKTRLYHVWPGNNVFFFGGRLVCGPDPRGLLLTIMSISVSSWIFATYVANNGISGNSSVVTICSIILTFCVLFNLGMVSMTDPGIVPRNDRSSSIDRSMRKTVEVNGVEVRLKYCRICNIFRPPRTRHCAVCDNCVERFDHHCPWMGQCIGQRNYRLYVLFVCTGLVYFAYIFAFSIQKVHHRMFQDDVGWMEMLRNCPETLALTTFSFAAASFLGCLSCYHFYLVVFNQTAYENFHQLYARSRNPNDEGFFSNVMEFLRLSRPPSRINFRAEVIEYDNSVSSSDQMVGIEDVGSNC